MLKRREFLGLTVALAVPSRAAEQVWNEKAAPDWTVGDAYVILNKSPWARHVDAAFEGGRPRPGGFTQGNRAGPGFPSRRRRVVVLWESAPPVREALKSRQQPPPANRYVISVDGLPLMPGRGNENLNYLRPYASLRGKDKTQVRPLLIRREIRASVLYIFEFPKNGVTLDADTKEAVFDVNFAGWMVKAGFKPREMRYRGELAL